MHILFCVLDGLADRPQKMLHGRTPLEAADTPNLNELAAMGATGLLEPFAPGVPLESETAHFLMFGYQLESFPGRTAFEAAGRGIEIPANSVGVLASFAEVSLDGSKVRRESLLWEKTTARDREDQHCEALVADIRGYRTDDKVFSLEYCGNCEAILTITGEVSRDVTDVDPFYNGHYAARAFPLATSKTPDRAARTAGALNRYLEWTYWQLSAHVVNEERQARGESLINFLLTKWAAGRPDVVPFEKMNGMRAASIEHYPLYIGIARICGMTPVVTRKHRRPGTDFNEKIDNALKLFSHGYDFVHIHSKAPDVAGHNKDPIAKRDALEELDAAFAQLVQACRGRSDLLVVVTGDHATPSSGPLIHSGEAVPFLVCGGPNVLTDQIAEFDERSVVLGGVGRIRATDVMPLLLNLTDRARLMGVQHQPESRPFWQWDPEPFEVK